MSTTLPKGAQPPAGDTLTTVHTAEVIDLRQRQRQRFGLEGIRLPPDRRKWMYAILGAAIFATLALALLAHFSPRTSDLEEPGGALDLRTTRRLAAMGFQPTSQRVGPLRVFAASQNFELKAGLGLVKGRPLAQNVEQSVAAIVTRELSRYPEGFLAEAGLWRVLLAAELEEEGRSIPSLPNVDHSMLLDGTIDKAFLPRLIHHEIYHFVDLVDDGSIIADDEWEALNAPGTSYGFGGREIRDANASVITKEFPGFVSRYATASIQEDKAELFSVAMSDPTALSGLKSRDRVLAAKFTMMTQRLAAFSPHGDHALPVELLNGGPREPSSAK